MSLASSSRRLLALSALLLGIWSAVVWLTGGLVFELGGLRVSSRAAARPALLAALLAGAAFWGSTADERRRGVARARRAADRLAPVAAALVALAVGASSATFNEHVAGGADSSGYLSQSRLWGQGRVSVDAQTVTDGPWPERGWLVSPLGYAPAARPGELGPSYAPGLPWLMAAGAALAGEAGRYVWTPLAVALLTWATFVLARREVPPAVALAAALLVATSPPLLFASMQTMSDLVCAALWTLALLALTRASVGGAVAGGVFAAAALVVRPNLVPVAGLVWLSAVATAPGPWTARLRRGLGVGLPLALAAAAIAAINQRLWGSPLASGYGATADLFQAQNVAANLANLWRWTSETGAYWMLLAAPALAWALGTRPRAHWWTAAALVGGLLVSYLPYAVFAEWWYLRFYLTAWPVLAAAVTWALWALAKRWSNDGAVLVVLALAVGMGATAVQTAADAGTFTLWRGAQRYPAVAAWVRQHAPADAFILSVQHSGALAYAADRAIGRWDYVPADGLDALVAALAARGRTVWLVADDLEEPPFRTRFAGTRLGPLDWAPLAEARVGPARVRIYDLTTPTRAVAPALIRVVSGGPWPWARQPATTASK